MDVALEGEIKCSHCTGFNVLAVEKEYYFFSFFVQTVVIAVLHICIISLTGIVLHFRKN